MSRLCIVDVCGTLVRGDTTLGLLAWHFRRSRRWRLWGFHAVTARWSPLTGCVVILERVTGRHLLKYMLVGWLRGDKLSDLQASAVAYGDWLLANRRVSPVQDVLAGEAGSIVLASASLEPIVRALSARIGARYVSSLLEVRGGRCTGRYQQDITGKKLEALQALVGSQSIRAAVVISDNLSDRSLMEHAGRAYVVLHKQRHRKRWGAFGAEYILI